MTPAIQNRYEALDTFATALLTRREQIPPGSTHMSVIRVGSTSTYAEGWAAIFEGKSAKKAATKPTAKKTKAAKKPVAKQAKKKRK